ncbi:MAG: membrane-bound lytic murein transglycosylase MltF [Gammaproteobacteria bacterium]|nr:MAG: membrane-bound lytic murein transglycosylase MltF [Gammaproteobacteria bacterium]
MPLKTMRAFIRVIQSAYKKMWAYGLLACLILVPACQPEQPLLERIKQSGELVVATQTGPTTYYTELDKETGLEYELAKKFAEHLNVDLKLVTFNDLGSLLTAVEKGEVHLAAAGLSVTRDRSQHFRFTPPYQQVSHSLVYRRGTGKPRSLEDLNPNELVVIANSSHAENLKRLKSANQQLATLEWQEQANTSMLDLLNQVHNPGNNVKYAVVDSNVFQLHRDIFPELRIAFDVKESEPLAWALNQQEDASLYTAAELFFNQINDDGTLEELRERFYGHRYFDYVGARTFIRHMDRRLPKYEDGFKQSAQELNMDWRLLAAISYQESLWNPNAISPTGVTGLMMLTLRTAREMGVSNRRNAKQSIQGGARYFKKLYDRLPGQIHEPHRSWFALAAYNTGYGHVMDARRLAVMDNADPNDWFEIKKRLPLLKKRQYYSKVPHGYARGGIQSVHYVKNVRRYYESLVWATERERQQYVPAPQNVVAMLDELLH